MLKSRFYFPLLIYKYKHLHIQQDQRGQNDTHGQQLAFVLGGEPLGLPISIPRGAGSVGKKHGKLLSNQGK